MTTNREFDCIIFGATGFTGQFVVEEVARTAVEDPIKWAVAGRSKDKLEQTLKDASKEVNMNLSDVMKIEADVSDKSSLLAMCKQARLIINCVGPYRFFGEQVVKACIEAGTHHIDISGEPQFLELMQLQYFKQAQDKGIYIVGACGWDSIPCDLGVSYLKQNFDGTLNSVETFMEIKFSPLGARINTGTWNSAIHVIANFKELKSIRRRLYADLLNKPLPNYHQKLGRKSLPFWNDLAKGWCVLFLGSDRTVVQRTQKYQYMHDQSEFPAQIQTYFVVRSIFALFGLLFISAVFGIFASFRCGRSLLEQYPSFFSCGYFVKGGPSRAELEETKFETIFVGKGWSQKMTNPEDQPNAAMDKTVITKVSGPDPGYKATSSCVVQAGFTILKEQDKMPKNGGVFTPGAAFSNTGLIERLQKRNITFEVIEQAK